MRDKLPNVQAHRRAPTYTGHSAALAGASGWGVLLDGNGPQELNAIGVVHDCGEERAQGVSHLFKSRSMKDVHGAGLCAAAQHPIGVTRYQEVPEKKDWHVSWDSPSFAFRDHLLKC